MAEDLDPQMYCNLWPEIPWSIESSSYESLFFN